MTTEESKTWPITIKHELTRKGEISEFCLANDLSVSEFFRNAGDLLMEAYPHLDKVKSLLLWLKDNKAGK